jgi:hypothetical protein
VGSHLRLALPVLKVRNCATATRVYVRPGADEHVAGWDDVRDRWLPRMVACEPNGDRDMVACAPIGNGEKAMQTQQQQLASVVVR